MKFNKGARIDTAQVGGSQGGGRGRPMAVGGGIGGVVLMLVLVLVFGPGVLDDLGGVSTAPGGGGGGQTALQHCKVVEDIEKDPDCRYRAYATDIEGYWATAMEGYQPAILTSFTGGVATACGQAGSEVGPFYCPADQTVYLDIDFLDELFQQIGAEGGPGAEAYVVAHEYGHHVQNLTGVMAKVQQEGQQTGAESGAVRLELQADCYAGVWFAHAADDQDGPIGGISTEEVQLAQNAAIAVGDDHIQRRSGGGVDPDGWTHGSSEQRKKWLMIGLETGDANRCDTFSGDI